MLFCRAAISGRDIVFGDNKMFSLTMLSAVQHIDEHVDGEMHLMVTTPGSYDLLHRIDHVTYHPEPLIDNGRW